MGSKGCKHFKYVPFLLIGASLQPVLIYYFDFKYRMQKSKGAIFLTQSHEVPNARSLFLNKLANNWKMRSTPNTKRFKPPIL